VIATNKASPASIRLYIIQRATALLMVPLIAGHLIVIFYATRHGLTAADILGRTRGNIWWGLYYTTFVLAASAHGAIGVRSVLREWGPAPIAYRAGRLDAAMWGIGIGLTTLGLRAVYAVVAP
jgi:fumarate reductase subunit C